MTYLNSHLTFVDMIAKRWSHFLLLLFALSTLVSCDNSQSPKPSENAPLVVCTTGMIADAVQVLGQGDVKVEALMGPGVDPHLYKASQGDLKKLKNARLVFYNGLHLEGKMGEVLEKLSNHKSVIAVSDGVTKDRLRKVADYGDAVDPHIWMDVRIWAEAVSTIREALINELGLDGDVIRSRADEYLAELQALDGWVRTEISAIPKERRVLVTAHDAFGYFSEAYNIEVKALQGLSTNSEYGLRDKKNLVNFILARKIPAIFVESSVSDRAVTSIIETCATKRHRLVKGGVLFSDAMGEEGSDEGTYIGMIKHNTNVITSALK